MIHPRRSLRHITPFALALAASALAHGAIAFEGQWQSRDFNGDGKQDLLFVGAIGSSAGGLVRVDLMNGLAAQGQAFLRAGGGTLRIAAIGDVDGDASSDIAFQGVPLTPGFGVVRIDRLAASGSGAAVVQQIYLDDGGGAWTLRGLADTDGDGADELLFEGVANTPAFGSVKIARVAGGAVAAEGFVPTGNGAWRLFGAQDMDGDGTRDLIFRGAAGSLADGLVRIDSLAGDGLTVSSQRIAVTGFTADALVGAGPGVLTFALPFTRRWVRFAASGPIGFVEGSIGTPYSQYSDPTPVRDLGAMDVDGDGKLDWVLAGPALYFTVFPFEAGGTSGRSVFADAVNSVPTDVRDVDGDGTPETISVAVGPTQTGLLTVHTIDPATGNVLLPTGYVATAGGAWRLVP